MIINIFGAPGSGKSTTRAGVFHRLKLMGKLVEEVPEIAKDLAHEGRRFALSIQPYVFGKQLKSMQRVIDKYDIVVTDSPVLLSAFYTDVYTSQVDERTGEHFRECCRLAHVNFGPSLNYWLNRVKPYNPIGRLQTEAESNQIGEDLKTLISDMGVQCRSMPGNENAVWEIVSDVLAWEKQRAD